MGRASRPHGSHHTPYCVVAQVFFGYLLRTMRAPEAEIPRLRRFGWQVVIRESDLLGPSETWRWADVQSGPRRERDEDERPTE